MKNIIKMAVAVLSAVVFLSASPAMAEATYGVVDMNKVLQDTAAAKGIFKELEGKRKEYQGQISKEEDALRDAEKSILAQREKLSKEDFEKKRGEFEKKVTAGQKMVQEHKNTLDQAFNRSMGKLRTEAAKIIAELAKEKGYSAVFTQEAVILSVPEMDMTEEIVKRMNDKVKKIDVDWGK